MLYSSQVTSKTATGPLALLVEVLERPLVVILRTPLVIAEFNLRRTSVSGIRAGVEKWKLIHSR